VCAIASNRRRAPGIPQPGKAPVEAVIKPLSFYRRAYMAGEHDQRLVAPQPDDLGSIEQPAPGLRAAIAIAVAEQRFAILRVPGRARLHRRLPEPF